MKYKVGDEFFEINLENGQIYKNKVTEINEKKDSYYVITTYYNEDYPNSEDLDEIMDLSNVLDILVVDNDLNSTTSVYKSNLKDALIIAIPIVERLLNKNREKINNNKKCYNKYREKLIEEVKNGDDNGIDICIDRLLYYKEALANRATLSFTQWLEERVEIYKKSLKKEKENEQGN